MRSVIVIVLTLVSSIPVIAQDTEGNVRKEVEALHAKWFQAFDSGDGATMDQLETGDLILVMPDGTIWPKKTARAGKQPKRTTEHTLSEVSVRPFGNTAILSGILTTRSAKGSYDEATMVVFVQVSGKWKVAAAQWTTISK